MPVALKGVAKEVEGRVGLGPFCRVGIEDLSLADFQTELTGEAQLDVEKLNNFKTFDEMVLNEGL